MWFISTILCSSSVRRKIHVLAIVILPLTVISILLPLFSTDASSENAIKMSGGLSIHVLSSLLAYSILMLAAIQACLLALQNNYLHDLASNTKKSQFMRTLPALEDMEYFLFNLLGIGVLLLSISLLSGFYYLENLFGSQIAHKTILSIFSWFIFSALLLGRWRYGWRGKKAVRWTLTGFLVLALAFFGSKFIQEFVLKQETVQIFENRQETDIKMTPPHFWALFINVNPNTYLINHRYS